MAIYFQNGLSLRELQHKAMVWKERNFGKGKPHQPLLGLAEEVGELAHAHLKIEQGIRTGEGLEAKRLDAVGDIFIFLMDYCNVNGLDLDECITKTWAEASKRDWLNNKKTGKPKA